MHYSCMQSETPFTNPAVIHVGTFVFTKCMNRIFSDVN